MNKKEALKNAHFVYQRVNAKRERLERLRTLAESCTQTISDMPKGTATGDKLANTVIQIVEMCESLSEDIAEELALYEQNEKTIAGISSSLGRTIFELRYLNFKTWQEIANTVGYERSYVAKIHDRILKEMGDE